jgi:catechol 2,3-dioxygenase-like lactoylglutathione lyase family enzyme
MINGIQQMGIGTPDVQASWKWYRKNFGFDIPVFDEAAEAPLMTQYTGGAVHARHALLAMNLNGGGGMEIWQFTSRKSARQHSFSLLQNGLLVTKIKCRDAKLGLESVADNATSAVVLDPTAKPSFSVIDPFGNPFIAAESDDWFQKKHSLFGGIEGVIIGVSDMERSLKFYREVLEIDKIIFDQEAVFEDLKGLKDGDQKFRRVRISPSNRNTGAFSEVFGMFHIDLLQPLEVPSLAHNLENRFWGDPGFIHLCFDVNAMDEIKIRADKMENSFTVDSGDTFSMGAAAGRFAYLEDPDGTLIELVETDKITVSKKLNWLLTLSQKRKKKPLPRWLFSVMALSRVKD